jgi:hypothetical protein
VPFAPVRGNSRNSRLFAVKVISLRSLPVLRSRPTAEGGRAFVARIPVRRLVRVFCLFRGDSHSQCGLMLARARADCVGKVVWNGDAVDPGRRSMTHLPWATIVRPYRTFSVCYAEASSGTLWGRRLPLFCHLQTSAWLIRQGWPRQRQVSVLAKRRGESPIAPASFQDHPMSYEYSKPKTNVHGARNFRPSGGLCLSKPRRHGQ